MCRHRNGLGGTGGKSSLYVSLDLGHNYLFGRLGDVKRCCIVDIRLKHQRHLLIVLEKYKIGVGAQEVSLAEMRIHDGFMIGSILGTHFGSIFEHRVGGIDYLIHRAVLAYRVSGREVEILQTVFRGHCVECTATQLAPLYEGRHGIEEIYIAGEYYRLDILLGFPEICCYLLVIGLDFKPVVTRCGCGQHRDGYKRMYYFLKHNQY